MGEKNIGKWLLDGGGGDAVVPQTDYRNFAYGGFLLKYTFNKRLELGGEVFAHRAEGAATPQIRGATMMDLGGYYHFHNPKHEFLFCYRHSVAGLPETYAYAGLYWTWGKDQPQPGAGNPFLGQLATHPGLE